MVHCKDHQHCASVTLDLFPAYATRTSWYPAALSIFSVMITYCSLKEFSSLLLLALAWEAVVRIGAALPVIGGPIAILGEI